MKYEIETVLDRPELLAPDTKLLLVCGFPRNLSIFLSTVSSLIMTTGVQYKVVVLAPGVPTHCPDPALLFRTFKNFACFIKGSGLRRIDLIR